MQRSLASNLLRWRRSRGGCWVSPHVDWTSSAPLAVVPAAVAPTLAVFESPELLALQLPLLLLPFLPSSVARTTATEE